MRLFFCRFHSDSQFYGFFVHDAHVLTVVVAKKCFTRRKTLNCYHTTIIRCSLRSTCFGECQAFHIISMSYISHSAQPTVSYHFFYHRFFLFSTLFLVGFSVFGALLPAPSTFSMCVLTDIFLSICHGMFVAYAQHLAAHTHGI